MGTLYIDTGGTATNSGTSDNNAADLSGSACSVAGSVVTLDGSPSLAGLSTSGANQAAINITGATNSNQTIFWITAVDDVLKTVTVSVAPTGVTTNAWKIGGRFLWTANRVESAIRAGELVVVNNSPASVSASWLTERTGGSSAAGPITVKGKAGVRPVITCTNTSTIISGSQAMWYFSNLELIQQGASGTVVAADGNYSFFHNFKISDGGGIGINGGDWTKVTASEIAGVGGIAVACTNTINSVILGDYIHDNASDGIKMTSPANGASHIIQSCILDTMAGKGMHLSGAFTTQSNCLSCTGNSIYGCGDSGLEIADADAVVLLFNNIFSENGNAAGEYNVEWVAGAAETFGMHAWNVFYHSGGGGGANLLNLTVNAQVANSEFTTDPLFTNAAGGDFSIGSTSPAKATGYPGAFLGGATGYLDIGAVQRQEPSGGGGNANILRGSVVA